MENSSIRNTTSNVAEYIFSVIENYGDRISQIQYDIDSKISFQEIVKRSKLFAFNISLIGISRGDIVCFISNNSINFAWATLGTLFSGASCALLSGHLKARELEYLLKLYQPKLIISTDLSKDQKKVVEGLENSQHIVIDENYMNILNNKVIEEVSYNIIDEEKVNENDIAFMLNSSGTTGLPKGVMLTHGNIISVLSHSQFWFAKEAKALGLMPFNHAYGLIIMLMGLCEGAEMVVMSHFDMNNFIECISRHKVTHLHIVPSLLTRITKSDYVSKRNFKHIRYIWTGAGQINPKHQEAVLEKFGNQIDLYHSYGLTETTFVVLIGKYRSDKPSSCGKIAPTVEIKVVSSNGNVKHAMQTGELYVRGPMVTKGYFKNIEATTEAIDEDGWLKTGDIGFFDDDGYFYIVDRIKEIIKYQGFQISPSEIESLLLTHNGVADVAVIGLPHPTYGELPMALVIKSCENVTEQELILLVQRELSYYKQLRGGVKFVNYIPKTSSGKILRRELKQIYI